tara:strand:- start:196 stop:357 length:162 start_codon:yes stop_codon:yes gene_type:complete
MTKKPPIYLSKLFKKFPLILSGRKNVSKNHQRIVKTKKLINDFKLKKLSSDFL